MKRLMTMAAAATLLLAASCSDNTYTIEGTVADPALEGAKVYKIERADTDALLSGRAEQKMDSTLVSGGTFQFNGKIDGPDYCTIYIPQAEDAPTMIYRTVVVDPGVTAAFVVDESGNVRVSGSPFNDELQKCEDAYNVVLEKYLAVYHQLESGNLSADEATALNQQLETLWDEKEAVNYDFVKNNINNPGAWSKLHNAAVLSTLEKQKELIAGASGKTLELPDYKTIVERIEKLEKTAEGQPFTDIALEDPDGNIMHLSDYAGRGKYILVDFWASWCGPCKAEMPNVVKCYHQYKDKGFDIVSISLDTKKENWVKAIDEWGMPWHHMSDLKGWGCEGANLYAVTGVPHAMLLGPDGTILARGLYGDALYAKLAEVMP